MKMGIGWGKLKLEKASLIVFPLIYFLTYWILGKLRGPFYLNPNNDPSYAYLGNSINLASLQVPAHIDHPGTPVQLLGAISIKLLFYIKSSLNLTSLPFTEETLSHTEFNLSFINFLLLGCGAFGLFLLGLIVFTLTQDLVLSLILQINSIFIYPIAQVQFFPETFHFAIAQILVILAVLFLYKENVSRKPWFLVTLGMALGVGIAAKVTFLPMLAFILLAPRLIRKLLVCLVTLLSFLAFTSPIISKYQRLFSWLTGIASRQGGYGSGEQGFIEPGSVQHFQNLFHQAPIFFSLFCFATLFCFLLSVLLLLNKASLFYPDTDLWNRFSLQPRLRASLIIIAIAVLTFLGQCALTLTETVGAIRYFVPSMALSQLLIFSFFSFATYFYSINFSRATTLKIFILATCVAISVPPIIRISERFTQDFNILNADIARIETIRSNPPYQKCLTVEGMGVHRPSTLNSALDFLNFWSGSYWSNDLMKLNPDFLRLDYWDNSYVASFVERKELINVLKENPCVLFRYSFNAYSTDFNSVTPQVPPITEKVELREIFHGRLEALDQIVLSP